MIYTVISLVLFFASCAEAMKNDQGRTRSHARCQRQRYVKTAPSTPQAPKISDEKISGIARFIQRYPDLMKELVISQDSTLLYTRLRGWNVTKDIEYQVDECTRILQECRYKKSDSTKKIHQKLDMWTKSDPKENPNLSNTIVQCDWYDDRTEEDMEYLRMIQYNMLQRDNIWAPYEYMNCTYTLVPTNLYDYRLPINTIQKAEDPSIWSNTLRSYHAMKDLVNKHNALSFDEKKKIHDDKVQKQKQIEKQGKDEKSEILRAMEKATKNGLTGIKWARFVKNCIHDGGDSRYQAFERLQETLRWKTACEKAKMTPVQIEHFETPNFGCEKEVQAFNEEIQKWINIGGTDHVRMLLDQKKDGQPHIWYRERKYRYVNKEEDSQ